MSDSLHGLVVFRLAGQHFALSVDEVREVVPICWLARPPGMPAVVEGILNLGGTAVPVLRLDRLLGLADEKYGLEASILVMRGAETLGLLVEHVEGVRPGADFTVMPVAEPRSFNGCLAGLLEREGGQAHLLSWRRLLLEEERATLAAFQAQAEARLADMAEAGQ